MILLTDRYEDGIDPDPDEWDSEVSSIETAERESPNGNGPAPKEQDAKRYKSFTIRIELGKDFNHIGNIHRLLQSIKKLYETSVTVSKVELEEVEEIEDVPQVVVEKLNPPPELTEEEIEDIRARMQYAAENWEWEKRVTLPKMAQYLRTVHPQLYVELDKTSTYKDTKYQGSRLRIPGFREYTGFKLRVWLSKEDAKQNSRYPSLINYDSTETYRRSHEVARVIVAYEAEQVLKSLEDEEQ